MMKKNTTFAYTCDLKNDPELIATYEEHHRAVWPEVLKSLSKVGVLEMQIFRLDTRMFMFCECIPEFEPETSFGRYLEMDEKNPQWEALMDNFQQILPQAQEGEKWLQMTEIFRMSEQLEKLD